MLAWQKRQEYGARFDDLSSFIASARLTDFLDGQKRTKRMAGIWLVLPALTILAWALVAATLDDDAGTAPVLASSLLGYSLAAITLALTIVVGGGILLAANLTREKDLAVLALATCAAALSSSTLNVVTNAADDLLFAEAGRASLLGFGVVVIAIHVLSCSPSRRVRIAVVLLAFCAVSPLVGVPLLPVQVSVCLALGLPLAARGARRQRPTAYAAGVLLSAIATSEMLVASGPDSRSRTTAALVLVLVGVISLLSASVSEVRTAFLRQCGAAREAQLTASIVSSHHGAVDHDRRAALAAVEGALTSLRINGSTMDPEELCALADAASCEVDRLRRMMNPRQTPVPQRVTVDDAIGSFLRCQQELGTGVSFVGDIDAEVFASPDTIARVVQNLVDNACEHGEATTVTVAVTRTRTHLVQIIVTDNGHGVDESVREVIFEPGVSSLPTRHTGIGLSSSRAAIEALGGTLAAVAPLAGSTGGRFVVTLEDPNHPNAIDLSVASVEEPPTSFERVHHASS